MFRIDRNIGYCIKQLTHFLDALLTLHSLRPLQYRWREASHLFRVARRSGHIDCSEDPDSVLGFVCSTAASAGTTELTHESMTEHRAEGGSVVCIHSVVVVQGERRRGLGKQMMHLYIEHLQKLKFPSIERALLLSKQELVHFYESVGFTSKGPSKVQHGQDTWIEMSCEFQHDSRELQRLNQSLHI